MDTEQLQRDLDAAIELVDRQTARIIEQAARIEELEAIVMEMAEDISSDDRIAPYVALFRGDELIEGHQAYLAAIIWYYAEKVKEKEDAKAERNG